MLKSSGYTIKEISSISGFSVSTVSKALNDKQDISLETRRAIKRIAKKFNYIPNNYAVALRSKTSKSIAVVLPEVSEEPYGQTLSYLQKLAQDFGYRVLLYQTFDSVEKEVRYVNSLNDGSIDGIIIISNLEKEKNNYNNNFPLILLNVNKSHSSKEVRILVDDSLNRLMKHK